MVNITVRPAGKADLAGLSAVLGRAFADDPVFAWVLPNAAGRAARNTAFFAGMARHVFLKHGGVEVADSSAGIAGATLWAPPGHWPPSRLASFFSAPSSVRAFGRRLLAGKRVDDALLEHHPEEPHWYLMAIGTDPAARGAGYGQALLRSRLDRCDAEHSPAYLESSNPVNVPYYERFGFETIQEITIPDGGPTLWGMWRTPR